MKIAFNLPQELQEFVEQSVKSGHFGSKAEMLINVLAGLKTQEEFRQLQIEQLRVELQNELAQMPPGETHNWSVDDFKRQARIRLLRIHLAVQEQAKQGCLQPVSAASPREVDKPEDPWLY